MGFLLIKNTKSHAKSHSLSLSLTHTNTNTHYLSHLSLDLTCHTWQDIVAGLAPQRMRSEPNPAARLARTLRASAADRVWHAAAADAATANAAGATTVTTVGGAAAILADTAADAASVLCRVARDGGV